MPILIWFSDYNAVHVNYTEKFGVRRQGQRKTKC